MRRTFLLLTLMTAMTGCAKAGSSMSDSAYPQAEYAANTVSTPAAMPVAGGAAGLDFEADDMAAEDAPMEAEAMKDASVSRGLFARARDRRMERRSTRTKASAPEGGDTAGARVDESRVADPEPAVADDQPEAHGRQIIYTAAMHVTVFNLEDAMEKAQVIPEQYGGYIQSLTAGQIIMRVPSRHLQTVMTAMGEYGVVESRTLNAQDVTAEYVDLESRIRVLRETQKQLIELLHKARNVQEALTVRQSLDQITLELELALGRMRQLENLVGFSTLTLTLVERGPHTPVPSSNDPFPWVDGLGVEATQWK